MGKKTKSDKIFYDQIIFPKAMPGELRLVEYDYHPREGDVGLQQKWTWPDGRTEWRDVPTVQEGDI